MKPNVVFDGQKLKRREEGKYASA